VVAKDRIQLVAFVEDRGFSWSMNASIRALRRTLVFINDPLCEDPSLAAIVVAEN
jgi:hypothetical protein